MSVGIGDEIVGAVAQRQLNHKAGLRHTAGTWDQIVHEKVREANAMSERAELLIKTLGTIASLAEDDNGLTAIGALVTIDELARKVLSRLEAVPLADRSEA